MQIQVRNPINRDNTFIHSLIHSFINQFSLPMHGGGRWWWRSHRCLPSLIYKYRIQNTDKTELKLYFEFLSSDYMLLVIFLSLKYRFWTYWTEKCNHKWRCRILFFSIYQKDDILTHLRHFTPFWMRFPSFLFPLINFVRVYFLFPPPLPTTIHLPPPNTTIVICIINTPAGKEQDIPSKSANDVSQFLCSPYIIANTNKWAYLLCSYQI